MRRFIIVALLVMAAAGQQPEPTVKFEASANLVVVNVSVKDREGNPIEGLSRQDFVVTEDGQPQTIAIFEYQRLSSVPLPALRTAAVAESSPQKSESVPPSPAVYNDRRLIVLFFDFSSMPPADQVRAQQAALDFLNKQMTEADLVSVMTFSNSLRTPADFTDDRQKLAELIRSFRAGEGAELPETTETAEEEGEETEDEPFVFDDTEFHIFNTDRKLSALDTAARALGSRPEKKALVYFTSGVGKTGVENHSQLRATVNAAVRSNVSFYPIDVRGLVASPPAGDARQAAPKLKELYSGRTQRKLRDRFNDQQETLYSLAADSGGKALLDSNDLVGGIVQAQKDIQSYYLLGYYSTNPAQDGRFRRIRVQLPSQPLARLDHRSGYYTARLFKDFDAHDKERQLEEALRLGDPLTDLPVALEINYFRLARDRYFVPVAVKIPGAFIALARKGSREEAELDFIGQVRDAKGVPVSSVRDAIRVKLGGEHAAQLARRHLQYDTGFTLSPGSYRLKFLARENQTGRIGTFETRFSVPDLGAQDSEVRMSSVVWSAQREPLSAAVGSAGNSRKLLERHPLIIDKQKLLPSITRAFRKDQNLYVYFEVYDTGTDAETRTPSVASTLAFYRGTLKVFESQPVRRTQPDPARRQSIPFQFQIPLASLVPGPYDCQVNVIDEAGRKFAFRRANLVLLP